MKISRSDRIQIVLETNAYLPVRAIDEESETDGSAQAGTGPLCRRPAATFAKRRASAPFPHT